MQQIHIHEILSLYIPARKLKWKKWVLNKRFKDHTIITGVKIGSVITGEGCGRKMRNHGNKAIGCITLRQYETAHIDFYKQQTTLNMNINPQSQECIAVNVLFNVVKSVKRNKCTHRTSKVSKSVKELLSKIELHTTLMCLLRILSNHYQQSQFTRYQISITWIDSWRVCMKEHGATPKIVYLDKENMYAFTRACTKRKFMNFRQKSCSRKTSPCWRAIFTWCNVCRELKKKKLSNKRVTGEQYSIK